jgi:hypothetical protein
MARWVVLCLGLTPALAHAQSPDHERTGRRLPPAEARATPNLRDQPHAADWQQGQPIGERRRWTRPTAHVPEPTPMRDPLLAVQEARERSPLAIGAPILNFTPAAFTGFNPSDSVGDVGLTQYVHMVNGASGAIVRVFDKNGTLLAGPTALETLGSGQCANGFGDPIVLFDQQANRWLLSEFARDVNSMCVYVSQTGDATGAYFAYEFVAEGFPSYPKYGVWPDAYYVGTNEGETTLYALQRSAMLTGTIAESQRFVAPDLPGFSFQMMPPADWDGATPPPAGAPAVFLRHRDAEAHGGAPTDPDTIELFQLHVDFAVPASSTLTGPIGIPVAEFDSNLCGLTSLTCIAQPTGVLLDPVREVVMNRAQYRNRGTHESIVGSFATDTNGADLAGVRWFELRKVGAGAWSLFQEGTIGGASPNRWMSTIAMDGSGNIAVSYNVSSNAAGGVFPGLRYTGRLAGDPPGTMAPEQVIVNGSAANATFRFGDYAAMTVDPVNDCTFWTTGPWNPAAQWSTRVATFRFPAGECIDTPVALVGFSIE